MTREAGQHVASICLTSPYLPPKALPEMIALMTPRERLLLIDARAEPDSPLIKTHAIQGQNQ